MKNRYIMLFLGISLSSYGQVFAYKDAPIDKDTLTKIKQKLDSLPIAGLNVRFSNAKSKFVSYLNEDGIMVKINTDSLVNDKKTGYLKNPHKKDFFIRDNYTFKMKYDTKYVKTLIVKQLGLQKSIALKAQIQKIQKTAIVKIDSVFVRMEIDSIALTKGLSKKLDSLMKTTSKKIVYDNKDNFIASYNKEVPSKVFEVLKILENPLPGDPLMNMRIVNNKTAPDSGGKFGCARDGTGCSSSDIPNLPKFTDKKKVHGGVDLYADLGTKIYAMFDGTVDIIKATVPPNQKDGKNDFGNKILIRSTSTQHNKNQKSISIYYTHLNKVEDLKLGDKITQGQLIGLTGSTGNASEIEPWRYHSHITIYENGFKVNPIPYFTTQNLPNKKN